MKGYFSSLIEQTGITFGPNRGLKRIPFETSPKGYECNDEITPIHIEERRLIEPWSNQATGRIHIDEDNTSVKTVQGIKDEITQRSPDHLNDERLTGHRGDPVVEKSHDGRRNDYEISPVQVSEKVDIQQPIEGKDDEVPIQEEQKVTFFDGDIRPPSEKSQPPYEIKRVELLERKEAKSSDIGAKEHVQQSNKPVDSGNQDSREATPSNFGAGSSNWNASLKEVKEWVAETPIANNDEGIRDRDAIETKKTEKRVYERQMQAPYYSKPIELPQGSEPQIHDLHLSIGTISLTLEGPQEKIQSNKPEQKIRRVEVPTKENNFSRLNRHYIRI